MRERIRQVIDDTRRSGDRIGLDGKQIATTQLGTEIIRLARVAASIHLAEATRLTAASEPARDPALSMRETVR